MTRWIVDFQLRVALGKQGDQSAVNRIMDRADVNGDGEISYDEYYRLMNMDKFGDSEVRMIPSISTQIPSSHVNLQGGNILVRQAIKSGLLKPNSVLGYTAMVGNKVTPYFELDGIDTSCNCIFSITGIRPAQPRWRGF